MHYPPTPLDHGGRSSLCRGRVNYLRRRAEKRKSTDVDNNTAIALFLGQHRTKIVRQLRQQIFRQIVQKRRRNTGVFQGVFVQYDGKDASK